MQVSNEICIFFLHISDFFCTFAGFFIARARTGPILELKPTILTTALICILAIGGFSVLTEDSETKTPSATAISHYGQTSYHDAATHPNSYGRSMPAVVSHPTLDHHTSGGASVSTATSTSSAVHLTSGAAMSTGLTVHTTQFSETAWGGGGGFGSGSSGGSSASASGGGGYSAPLAVAANFGSRGGGGAIAMNPGRPVNTWGAPSSKDFDPNITEVYEDDAPGVITGEENSTLDNPIVTSYDQPLGDMLLPLLLFAILFICYKHKTMLKSLTHISLSGKRSTACLMALCAVLLLSSPAYAGQEQHDYDGDGVLETYYVVYLNSSSGDDGNDGSSSAPVKTLAKAYSKLPAFNTATDDRDAAWDSNIIVVAGSVTLDKNVNESATGNRPATITSFWPWTTVTANNVRNGGKVALNGVNSQGRIGADTKFKYARFSGSGVLNLYLHDCTFDLGCIMDDTGDLTTANGALAGRKTANIQLFLLADPYEFSTTTTDGGWNSLMKKPVTLTMRSGKFGRILCTRITGTTADPVSKRYVVGNPEHPLQAIINVDLDPNTSDGDWNKKNYVDDIALLCAGTSQGTVYADVQMNIKRGKISTLVAGSQGNAIAACETAGLPTSTYVGRTIVNLMGKTDDDVQIYRYFGACLGRLTGDGASGECKAYYYGHSILNLTHGTIERDLFASAGGLSGLKNPNNDTQYTTDTRIPYQGGSMPNYPYMGIDYSAYSASKTIVSVKSDLYGTIDTIDLAETKITFNISGGIIKGNVYGGSYGYSEDMTAGAAPTGAGSLWGNTEVNISGGTIQGSVYAGGGGTTDYYTKSTTDAMRAKYLDVATVYGNTNLTITGKPTIADNIYGGGAGVKATGAVGTDTEFLNIGKIYGNTNVTIDADDDWTFTGNIYGGGAMGAVEGNTNVTILGGIIEGDVFGAGQGEEGHPDKAKVTGSTNVIVGEEATR